MLQLSRKGPISMNFGSKNVGFYWRTLRKTVGARTRTNNEPEPHVIPSQYPEDF